MLSIYTDGGCHGNPGPGAWAYVIIDNTAKDDRSNNFESAINESYGAAPLTTNNQMELSAVISALKYIDANNYSSNEIAIYTDSQYVQKGISQWIKNWKRNGWRTADKKPVKNAELWQQLDALCINKNIIWRWVKAHNGDPLNERCDQLVQIAIAMLYK
ncbi:MAG: ribonuclease HI [Termitinemataceae bacterium]|nr:MAG: ribonuclease HI [Termitinemataceae bacterium]